jgi:hypothetical protein
MPGDMEIHGVERSQLVAIAGYVAAYIGVVVTAIGLVMLPVHLASYRERGVLRRFDVSRYPAGLCQRPGSSWPWRSRSWPSSSC